VPPSINGTPWRTPMLPTRLAAAVAAGAAGSGEFAMRIVFVTPGGLKWEAAPRMLPAGSQMAVVSGDPSKPGPYVFRVKMPAGYRIPAHHHPTTENVTVLSGSFYASVGEKLEEKNGFALEPGGFASFPANVNHYAWATAETVVQFHGEGPFSIIYVNPADDPSKKDSF
jgi:quercetin dioxygenase-like cupin family protein